MRPWFSSIILAAWVLGGCATHFQEIKEDQVYLYLKDTRQMVQTGLSKEDATQC